MTRFMVAMNRKRRSRERPRLDSTIWPFHFPELASARCSPAWRNNIAYSIVQELGHKLAEENINVSPTWDSDVLNSTTPPFSDKLIMYHIAAISGLSIGIYGTSLGTVSRRDLGSLFMKILTAAIAYAEDGANLMIENQWLEEPPHSLHNISIAKRSEYE
jgi:hypothetical protein